MDIIQLYQDFSVPHATEGHKHCRPGWVNTECPFCTGNPGLHLGYNLYDDYFYCWRCGWHDPLSSITELIHLPEREVRAILQQYGLLLSPVKKPSAPSAAKEYRMPSGTGPLEENHRRYLERRRFDPDRLEREWNLVGTGPVSRLDSLDLKFRIIIPVLWNYSAVSFTSRDITDKHPAKYITCPKDRERIFHKTIIYGRQEKWGRTGICVEGPTDVWRLGSSACATFGIKYTPAQVRQIAKAFKRVAIMFDNESEATKQAKSLVADLKFRGVDAFRVEIIDDPGSMSQAEADYMVKQIIN
jgi:hypothetical protein